MTTPAKLSSTASALVALIVTHYRGTDPIAAANLARSLERRGHVQRDATGALVWTREGREALPRCAPLPVGEDDRTKCARAYQRERAILGVLPAPETLDAAPAPAQRANDGTFAPPPAIPTPLAITASDGDKTRNAMAREDALRAALALGSDE